MEDYLTNILKNTRFTTNKVYKEFLPRRIGLGYVQKYEKFNREILKPCLKAKRKQEKEIQMNKNVVDNESSEEEGKLTLIKKKRC